MGTETGADVREIRRRLPELMEWAEGNGRGRDLPWRGLRDPYRVWISEVLLQQTRVSTVLPYYRAFLEAFPDVKALAEASQEEVLKVWEGLGYYSRARNLRKAAQEIVREYGGELPAERDALLRLPGIGRSTAGAILSLAHNLPYPVLDGNVKRVLFRLFALERDLRKGETSKALWRLAEALLPRREARRYNEAMMDLGALLCTPRNPRCQGCPLSPSCQAYLQGRQEEFPPRPPKKKRPHYEVSAGVVWRGGKIFIDRRPEEGLLGGLWEFPGGKREAGETLEECLVRELREEFGLGVEVGECFERVDHAYTHFQITLYAFHCRYLTGGPPSEGPSWKWVSPEELERFPFPAADKRVLRKLRIEGASKKVGL
jgi:A/G-specific adenine glycosylase